MPAETPQNVLYDRYASAEMCRIFSARHRYSLWRQIWMRLAECQQELGLPITDEGLAYLKTLSNLRDLAIKDCQVTKRGIDELQRTGSDAVVVVDGGEGSTSEGDWHEAMNFAGIHKLPVIFLIQNNLYAISVPAAEEVAGQIADRAEGYGMKGVVVDGNNVLEMYGVAAAAVERARAGEGPTLIEAKTYRFRAHSMFDAQLYREKTEVEDWRQLAGLDELVEADDIADIVSSWTGIPISSMLSGVSPCNFTPRP